MSFEEIAAECIIKAQSINKSWFIYTLIMNLSWAVMCFLLYKYGVYIGSKEDDNAR